MRVWSSSTTANWGSDVDPNRIQIHFELDSKHAAQAFAKELAMDGFDIHQVGAFVFIFADDGAAARKLGNALKERAPANAQLFFEGEGRNIPIRAPPRPREALPRARAALLDRS